MKVGRLDAYNKLATRRTDPAVVRSLVEIAKARGWETIFVKGTEDFRRNAWLEATQNGLTVAGYKPTALDLADLANRPANNTIEKGAVQEKSGVQKQSSAQSAAAQANLVEPTTAKGAASKASPSGDMRPDPKSTVKAKAFREDKPAFVVKRYPDLAAAYGIVAAANAFAAEKLPEAAREEFVEIARRHMIEKIMAGEQIQGPKIYVASIKTADVGSNGKAAGEAGDQRKSPRARAAENER